MFPSFPRAPHYIAGRSSASLLESFYRMADWKQITARIRRARTGKDPAGQLANLFSKTRDAMVAFELARYFESSGNPADAGRWYLTAAERFRRSDWKTKAQESATRLGATEPAEIPVLPPRPEAPKISSDTSEAEAVSPAAPAEAMPPDAVSSAPAEEPAAAAPRQVAPAIPGKPRRGRRGGRDHHRSSRRTAQSPRDARPELRPAGDAPAEETHAESPAPSIADSVAEIPAPSLRGRSGDPGLSSRLSQLEMNFRRLLACAPVKLEDAGRAPAGPGVWVLTDSDLTTYYYVESCQTLRVAIPNLLRSGATRRGETIKPQLAEHLGIPESRVAKYLSEHCAVRWLQMDDGAAHFAHFLIAVLHPTLNE